MEDYKYKGKSLTGIVASDLILELFDRQTAVPKKNIEEEVKRIHRSRGGLDQTRPTNPIVAHGLTRLKKQGKATNEKEYGAGLGFWNIDSAGVKAGVKKKRKDKSKKSVLTVGDGSSTVYLYYFQIYHTYAKEKKLKSYPCKIGRTDAKDPVAYIMNQAGTALPEKPTPGLFMKTDDPVGLEARIHRALDNVDLRMKSAPGDEWFYTNIEQVQEFYELVK